MQNIVTEDEFKENQKEFNKILDEARQLRWKKLLDYGMSYQNFGYVGVLARMGDKYARVVQLYKKSLYDIAPNFENARDSLIDLINYAAMAVMELDKEVDDDYSAWENG